MPQLDIAQWPPQLFWLAITFAALYYIVTNHIIPGVGGAIAARRERIEGDIAAAQQLKGETDAALAAYDAAIAEARGRAGVIARDNRNALTGETDRHKQALDAELGGRIAAAEQAVAGAKDRALADVSTAAADLAADIVTQLTGARAGSAELAAAVARARMV